MASTLKVDTIQTSGGTTSLTTNSDGVIFRSNIPHFFASYSSQTGINYANSWNKLQFVKDAEYGIPASSDFDDTNNRYVAPVAGLYWHGWSIRVDSFGGGYIHCETRKNNTSLSKYRAITSSAGSDYHSIGCQGIVYLGVGDYIEAFVNFSGDSSVNLDNDSSFHGYLIG